MKYKIVDYCWELPEQFEMIQALKESCEFYYCLTSYKDWDHHQQPKPDNLHFITHYEEGRYDLAILHIDQEAAIPHHFKRRIFTEFNDAITDIPKIVINHGLPNGKETTRAAIQELIGDNTMVVPSYQAAVHWGMGIPLIPGIDQAKWRPQKKEPRVLTVLPGQEFDSYYNKDCLKAIGECLYYSYGYILKCANYNVLKNSTPAGYRNYLERSLLFLDTSLQTPMNQARTEAFLAGCCVIQLKGACDMESWFTHGEDIMIVPDDPKKIAALMADMLENRYDEAIRIGENGRKTALRYFDVEQYKNSWLHLFENAIQSFNCVNT